MATALIDLPVRRILVVSDRYPPDVAGGAELSLHLLLREPVLRDAVLVVTFDRALAAPVRRRIDGVEVFALPAPAAWPLHRLSQAKVDRLKTLPFRLKWLRFVAEGALHAARGPRRRIPAFALRLAGAPAGGVRMDHETIADSGALRLLRDVIDRMQPALVHADNARAVMMAAKALDGRPTPLVALVRDHRFASLRFDQTFVEDHAKDWRGRTALACARDALAFRRACLGRAARVIATSRVLEERLRDAVPEGRLIRAPLIPIAAPAEAPAPRTGPGFRVLVVGSLTANKGQAHLLGGWRRLASRIPAVEIDFAGAGPDETALRALGAEADAAVRLHGMLGHDALAALYAGCDVVAAPTLWEEPFGRAPLEAGAAARPVVAYASGGLADSVVDGETGLLAPPGDLDGFIGALAALAADPGSRLRMGAAGRERAVRDHAPAALAARLKAIWDEAAPG